MRRRDFALAGVPWGAPTSMVVDLEVRAGAVARRLACAVLTPRASPTRRGRRKRRSRCAASTATCCARAPPAGAAAAAVTIPPPASALQPVSAARTLADACWSSWSRRRTRWRRRLLTCGDVTCAAAALRGTLSERPRRRAAGDAAHDSEVDCRLRRLHGHGGIAAAAAVRYGRAHLYWALRLRSDRCV